MNSKKLPQFLPEDGGIYECTNMNTSPDEPHIYMGKGFTGNLLCCCGGIFLKVEPKPEEKKNET